MSDFSLCSAIGEHRHWCRCVGWQRGNQIDTSALTKRENSPQNIILQGRNDGILFSLHAKVTEQRIEVYFVRLPCAVTHMQLCQEIRM